MKPIESAMLYVAIAALIRRLNQCPTIAMLTTESAPWPIARVAASVIASARIEVT